MLRRHWLPRNVTGSSAYKILSFQFFLLNYNAQTNSNPFISQNNGTVSHRYKTQWLITWDREFSTTFLCFHSLELGKYQIVGQSRLSHNFWYMVFLEGTPLYSHELIGPLRSINNRWMKTKSCRKEEILQIKIKVVEADRVQAFPPSEFNWRFSIWPSDFKWSEYLLRMPV